MVNLLIDWVILRQPGLGGMGNHAPCLLNSLLCRALVIPLRLALQHLQAFACMLMSVPVLSLIQVLVAVLRLIQVLVAVLRLIQVLVAVAATPFCRRECFLVRVGGCIMVHCVGVAAGQVMEDSSGPRPVVPELAVSLGPFMFALSGKWACGAQAGCVPGSLHVCAVW